LAVWRLFPSAHCKWHSINNYRERRRSAYSAAQGMLIGSSCPISPQHRCGQQPPMRLDQHCNNRVGTLKLPRRRFPRRTADTEIEPLPRSLPMSFRRPCAGSLG
jgi:hypothetical protein